MATKTWAAAADGNWNINSNWSPVNVPVAGDDVVFDATSVKKCTLNTNPPILGSLTATSAYTGAGADDGHLDLDIHDLTVSGDMTLDNKQVSLGSGTFTIGGNLDFADVVTWNYETSEVEFTAVGGNKTITSPAGDYWDLKFYRFTVNSGSNKVTWNSGDALACAMKFMLSGEFEISGSGRSLRATGPSEGVIINAGSILSGDGTFVLHMVDTTPAPVIDGRVTCFFTYNMAQFNTGHVAAVYYENDLAIHNSNAGDYAAEIAAGTLRVGGAFAVYHLNATGTATINNTVNDPDFVFEGAVTVETGFSGTVVWTAGTGTITLRGSENQVVDFADKATENLTINKLISGNVTLTGVDLMIDAIDLVGNLTITGSAITSSADAKNINGDFDFSDAGNDIHLGSAVWTITDGHLNNENVGTFSRGGSLFVFSGTCQWSIKNSVWLYDLEIAVGADVTLAGVNTTFGTHNTLTVYGTVNVPTGKNFWIPGTCIAYIKSGGRITGAGRCYQHSSQSGKGIAELTGVIDTAYFYFYLIPAADALIASGTYGCATVQVAKTTGSGDCYFTPDGDMIFLGHFTIYSGISGDVQYVDCANGRLIPHSHFSITEADGGVVSISNGDISLQGTAAQSLDTNGVALGTLTIDKAEGTVTQTSSIVCTTFNLRAGTFDPNGEAISITGDFTINAGANIIAGNDAMNGVSLIVGGRFDAQGTGNRKTNLRGTATWTLDVGLIAFVVDGDISYCDATTGSRIFAYSSTDGGNNFNVAFDESIETGRSMI